MGGWIGNWSLTRGTHPVSRNRFLPVAIILLSLAGCKTPKLLCFSSSGLQRLTITSSAGTNHGRPIAVDLVYVTDRKILAAIEKLKARDYFAVRTQLQRDYPTGLAIRGWELQAGQQVVADAVAAPCNLAGTFLFADFAGAPPQENRLRLRKVKRGTLTLGEEGFSWTPDKG